MEDIGEGESRKREVKRVIFEQGGKEMESRGEVGKVEERREERGV